MLQDSSVCLVLNYSLRNLATLLAMLSHFSCKNIKYCVSQNFKHFTFFSGAVIIQISIYSKKVILICKLFFPYMLQYIVFFHYIRIYFLLVYIFFFNV